MSHPSFTKKSQVTDVIRPIVEFAQDVGRSFEPHRTTLSGAVVATITDGEIAVGSRALKQDPPISQHRRLAVHAALSQGRTDTLEPLAELLSHVAPLAPDAAALQIVICHAQTVSLKLYRDGILLCEGEDAGALAQRIYVFLRTHENLDMEPRLRPYRIDLRSGYCPMRDVTVYADCADNALMRFAACNDEIQTLVRQKARFECRELHGLDYDKRIQMINGRSRQAPAAPRAWTLT